MVHLRVSRCKTPLRRRYGRNRYGKFLLGGAKLVGCACPRIGRAKQPIEHSQPGHSPIAEDEGPPTWREPHLPPPPNDVATRELGFSGHPAVLARSREPDCWRRLLRAQKERIVPQANCGQDRRRVRAAELDLGLS
jgi:hypothetical protein